MMTRSRALSLIASVLLMTGCSRTSVTAPSADASTNRASRSAKLPATFGLAPAPEAWLPLLGCTPATCGGYTQNLATLTFRKGDAALLPNDRVRIRIMGLASLATGQIVAGNTLEVFVGLFDAPASEQWWISIGYVTVDQRGNVNEFVIGPDGEPYTLSTDVPHPLQLILNDPGERSEFVTRRFGG